MVSTIAGENSLANITDSTPPPYIALNSGPATTADTTVMHSRIMAIALIGFGLLATTSMIAWKITRPVVLLANPAVALGAICFSEVLNTMLLAVFMVVFQLLLKKYQERFGLRVNSISLSFLGINMSVGPLSPPNSTATTPPAGAPASASATTPS